MAIRLASNPEPLIVDGADPMSSELRSFDGIGFNVVPQGATILQGRSHTLYAQAIVAPSGELTMQWVKNGTPIPGTEFLIYGATASYTIASATLADAGAYALRVTVGALTVDSPVATLVVEADNEPPVLISGGFLPGSGAVGLMFSEPVNVGTATFTVAGATVPSGMAASIGTTTSGAMLPERIPSPCRMLSDGARSSRPGSGWFGRALSRTR